MNSSVLKSKRFLINGISKFSSNNNSHNYCHYQTTTKLFFSSQTLPSIKNASSSSSSSLNLLDQFRDPTPREKRNNELVGRSWSVNELRRKNFEDLHRLWIVLYKEKNMLLTEASIARTNGVLFPQPERRNKVKKSMAAIKVVLGERKRDKIAQHALKMSLLEEELRGLDSDDVDDDGIEDQDEDTKENPDMKNK